MTKLNSKNIKAWELGLLFGWASPTLRHPLGKIILVSMSVPNTGYGMSRHGLSLEEGSD